MRDISSDFAPYHFGSTKEPRQVVRIDFSGTDSVYFTSHADAPYPAGATAIVGVVAKIGGTTQQIAPDEGRSTIGNISIDLLDKSFAVTSVLKQRDDTGKGARGSRVLVYVGYRGMTWSQFANGLVQTQIIDDVTFGEGFFTIACADVQRSMRSDIFVLATTTLSQSIATATQTLIPVYSVANFQMLQHGSTYTDAPNAKVGYIKIEEEVIRWSGTTTDSLLGLCFQATQRGCLGTKAVAHQVDASAASDQRTPVEEFVYLELPAVKLMYAILTGSLYGQPGEHLPDSWHLAIGGEYVRTANFTGIGADLWNSATDDGFIVRFAGEAAQDGKKFIETQLCLLTGTYMPIYSNGELGLRRFTSVLHNAPHVFDLTVNNVKSHDRLRFDQKSVFSLISIQWNFDFIRDKLTRQRILIDEVSRSKYKDAPAKTLQFRGLHGSRHTTTTVEGLFNRLRDRYAAPPQRLTLKSLPYTNRAEVGDISRVTLPTLRDYFTGAVLDRAFEVQQVAVDWVTGDVSLQLFGSSQPASPIRPSNPGQAGVSPGLGVLPDAFFPVGTNLATYAGVTSSVTGGVRHITGGSGLVGNDTNCARYYHVGDLELNSGVTLPFTKNVLLVVKGHLQINGKFNGKGRGLAGASVASSSGAPLDGSGISRVNYGAAGYIGPSQSAGGTSNDIQFGRDRWDWYAWPGWRVDGAVPSVPAIVIDFDGVDLSGLPAIVQGCSGSSGRNSFNDDTHDNNYYMDGGAGGAGGAGLIIIARGISFGASGEIDSSGNDGAPGSNNGLVVGGSGAGGAPGAVIFIVDGIDNEIPDLPHVTAKYGKSPVPTSTHVMAAAQEKYHPDAGVSVYTYFTGYGDSPPDLSGFGGGTRVLFVPPLNTPQEDTPAESAAATAIALNELINTPVSTLGNQSTIEVSVTPPVDGTYSYSNIYYRVYGSAQAWKFAGPADPEFDFIVLSDGTAYEVLALPVNISGVESSAGPSAHITTTAVATQLPANISGLRFNYVAGLAQITWDPIRDVRAVDYEVRAGSTWAAGILITRSLATKITVPSNASYWIAARAIGPNGEYLYSATPQEVVIAASAITKNIVAQWDQVATSWPGTFTGGAALSGSILQLDGAGDILGAADFLAITDVLNYGTVQASGIYTAPSGHTINVGRVSTCTVQINYTATAYIVDGSSQPTAAQDIDIVPQIAIAQADGVYGAWQNYVPGEYTAQYFKTRMLLATRNSSVTPHVSQYVFRVDVPDRIDRGATTTSTGAIVHVTYAAPFNGGANSNLPLVSIQVYNASQGDDIRITNQTVNGFDVDVINGGSRVARSIGYTSEGY